MDRRSRLLFVGVALVGLALLAGPYLARTYVLNFTARPYAAPAADLPNLAATPAATATARPLAASISESARTLGPGEVIVDFAHFNQVNAAGLQPMAAALSRRGLATRLWISEVDAMQVESVTDFPDQSNDLEALLRDASALVVVSPLFLWTPQEIATAERFVADGGRVLLISDPDIVGDAAIFMNLLAEPFGVVFNDDYLYDTVRNDENFTHFFLAEFVDLASGLQGSRIAMYGGRSISGDVTALARSAPTTLSSRRAGVSKFTTVALGGKNGRISEGRVLALSDFDVLTEPNVTRHDNANLLEFVAAFLTGGKRDAGMADFPSTLDEAAQLVIGVEGALDADTLLLGARVQRRVEETGRTLALAAAPTLTSTWEASSRSAVAAGLWPESGPLLVSGWLSDVVVLADYDYANQHTDLLKENDITLVTERITPTVGAQIPQTPVPTPSPVSDGAGARELLEPTRDSASATATVTPTLPAFQDPSPTATPVSRPEGGDTPDPAATAGATPTTAESKPTLEVQSPTSTPTPSATPSPVPTPSEVTYLIGPEGLKLLAAETALVMQQTNDQGHHVIAALGRDSAGMRSAVDRLLSGDFDDCIVGLNLTLCPVKGATPAPSGGSSATPAPTSQATATPQSGATPTPGTAVKKTILLVDDNAKAIAGELSEADRYLQVLAARGYAPDLWTTAESGTPSGEVMGRYAWVIWSNAGYAESAIDVSLLDPFFAYLNDGGRMTISSRRPFFGMGVDPASHIDSVVTVEDIPDLVAGLPDTPIHLEGGAPVIPLADPDEQDGFRVVLARAPDSEAAGRPAAIAATDEGEQQSTDARLVVTGLSVTWLPFDVADRFISNMAGWVLKE